MHNNMTRDEELVACYSDTDTGWSLHAPGSTDEEIAEGVALPLVSGTGAITASDVAWAQVVLAKWRTATHV